MGMASGDRGGTNMLVAAVVIIAVAFGVSSAIRPFVPQTRSSRLAGLSGDYLAMGTTLPVEWIPPSHAAKEMARAAGKPMLLVIGRASSPAAQAMDGRLFVDPEIAEQISRQFVPVRIDLDEHPYWEGVIFPVQRVRVGFQSGFEMAVVDPDLGLVDWTALMPGAQPDLARFADFLRRARAAARGSELKFQAAQATDWASVDSASGERLDDWMGWAAGQLTMDASRPSRSGFLGSSGGIEARPWLWRGIAASGRVDLAWQALSSALSSPMTDGLNGTLFTVVEGEDMEQVFAHKSAEVNAEALVVAALASSSGSSLPEGIPGRIAEGFRDEFLGEDGPVTTLFGAPAGSLGESAYAFRQPQIWSSLSPSEQAAASRFLGLDALSNPSMKPYPRDLEAWADPSPALQRLTNKLRTFRSGRGIWRGQTGPSALRGAVAARLMEAGLLLQDKDLIGLGREASQGLRACIKPDGRVSRRPRERGEKGGPLADRMAAAESLYFEWLAGGTPEVLTLGKKIVDRTLADLGSGEAMLSAESAGFGPPGLESFPLALADGLGTRSDAARAIEVLSLYGALDPDGPAAETARLLAARLEPLLAVQKPGWTSLASALQRHKTMVMVQSRAEWRTASINSPGALVAVQARP